MAAALNSPFSSNNPFTDHETDENGMMMMMMFMDTFWLMRCMGIVPVSEQASERVSGTVLCCVAPYQCIAINWAADPRRGFGAPHQVRSWINHGNHTTTTTTTYVFPGVISWGHRVIYMYRYRATHIPSVTGPNLCIAILLHIHKYYIDRIVNRIRVLCGGAARSPIRLNLRKYAHYTRTPHYM